MKLFCAIVVLAAAGYFPFPRSAPAVPIDALDPSRPWRVERIEICGNRIFAGDELKGVILTKERPWYRFWDERPAFDPITFGTDLERVQRYYEARGYYDTAVVYDLGVDDEPGLVAVRIEIREGLPPVKKLSRENSNPLCRACPQRHRGPGRATFCASFPGRPESTSQVAPDRSSSAQKWF